MMYNYFSSIKFIDILNIYLYFWVHVILSFFFSLHFFCVKFLKYKVDWKNITLKNLKKNENYRTVSNTYKTIFFIEGQSNLRNKFYLK